MQVHAGEEINCDEVLRKKNNCEGELTYLVEKVQPPDIPVNKRKMLSRLPCCYIIILYPSTV